MDFLVNLDVDDIDKAARFYASAFGLKVGRRFAAFGIDWNGGLWSRTRLNDNIFGEPIITVSRLCGTTI
jgi:catechol 2,3-dioxygenase-like lactoylglutathione lyase family enzyme